MLMSLLYNQQILDTCLVVWVRRLILFVEEPFVSTADQSRSVTAPSVRVSRVAPELAPEASKFTC